MVMYSITTKLNSTFGMTSNTMADRVTGKVVGKLGLSLCVKNEFHTVNQDM